MADLNVLVVGENGSGKSTAGRVVVKALREAGFLVDLVDMDDMSEERFSKCLEAVKGRNVRVTCGNVRVNSPSTSLTPAEKAKGRSDGYHDMSPRDQWDEDKRLGILDWDGK